MALIAGVLLFTLVVLFWLIVIEISWLTARLGTSAPKTSTQRRLTEGQLRHDLAACVCIVVASGD